MGQLLQFAVLGFALGAIYAVLATSLVGVYAATGIINFAQGAIGLYSVYVVAALRTDGSLVLPIGTLYLGTAKHPTPMGLAIAIGILSAIIWALLAHFLVFRPLRRAPVLAQVVASVGLMLFLQALVQLRFDIEDLEADDILPKNTIHLGDTVINVSDLILAGVAIVIAALFWAYFRLTTWGVATRAGSEDELASRLTGFSPDRLAGIVWGITGAATGLIAILSAPTIGLTVTTYTFFVIPALAVALLGRLTSFGVACATGLVLGSFQSVIAWLTTKDWWPDWAQSGIGDAVPFVVIIVALFAMGGRIPSRGSLGEVRLPAVRIPRIRPIHTIVILAIAVVAIVMTDGSWRIGVTTSIILSLIALSLVLLTGYLGQISLASMAFAGAAGFALSKITTNWNVPFPFDMILAALIATFLGILVGIPALRIRGAQLAVVTLAAALAIQSFIFNNPALTDSFKGNLIEDPALFGLDLGARDGTTILTLRFSFLVLIIVTIATLVVLRFMGGSTGRAFLAVRSNERAAASVGINVAATKLLGFALSAFLAGIGGCLIGYREGQISGGSFTVIIGLTLLAMTYVGGITSFAGAVIAGIIGPLGIGWVFMHQTLELGQYYEVFAAGSLLLMAVLNPEGVAGAVHKVVEHFRHHPEQPPQQAPPPPDASGTPTTSEAGAHV